MDHQIPKQQQQLGVRAQQLTLKQTLETKLPVASQLHQIQVTPSSPQLLGMMMLPALTTGQLKVATTTSVLSEASCGVPVILQSQHSIPELNFIMSTSQQQQQLPLMPVTSRAYSGTVHHMGSAAAAAEGLPTTNPHTIQPPAKELSFAHLKMQLSQDSSFRMISKPKRQRDDSEGYGSANLASASYDMLISSPVDVIGPEAPLKKKIKVEEDDEMTGDELSINKKLYCTELECDLEVKGNNYQALVMEFFFLENGGNFMDYFAWQKRASANPSLMRFIQSKKADDLGEYDGNEKSINNEVKVLTTSGGTLPIVTPVAISKTLPPAISAALQQQQQQENCGIPLSTTAATTTIGSPPPYTAESSSSTSVVTMVASITTSVVTMTSALPRVLLPEGIKQSVVGTTACHLADSYHQSRIMARDQLSESLQKVMIGEQHFSSSTISSTSDISLSVGGSAAAAAAAGGVGSQEAVEIAKQEAQVIQRIAELRKQGIWSQKQLPKVQETSRHKSHWDYLLEEMQWMAVDFAQERLWKMSVGKHIATDVMKQHKRIQEERQLRQKEAEERLKSKASTVAKMIKDFWSNMREMALHSIQKDVELHHRKLLNYVTSTDQKKDDNSSCIKENLSTQTFLNEGNVNSEIEDLITEGEMSVDELVKKYAGAYEKEFEAEMQLLKAETPESQSDSSSQCYSTDVEEVDVDVEEAVIIEDCSEAVTNEMKDDVDHIKTLLKKAINIQPTVNTCDLSTVELCKSHVIRLTPRDYQVTGINWLRSVNESGFGCILSDEEGLGRKVQIVCFLALLTSEKGNWGRHLIVVPSGSLFSWQLIFNRWCPALKIFVYYGNSSDRAGHRLNWLSSDYGQYHVCLTSYKSLKEDLSHFSEQTWNCLIIDQAENLKSLELLDPLLTISNDQCILMTKVLLVEMSLKELASLLLLTLSFDLRSHFKRRFRHVLEDELSQIEMRTKDDDNSKEILENLALALSLRRLHQDVIGQLPKLEITDVQCHLSKRQQILYSHLMSVDSTKDTMTLRRTRDVLCLTLTLQKLCNHPDLIESRPTISPLFLNDMTLSLPALIDEICREEDPLKQSDALVNMTSLLEMELDFERIRNKQRPLIEELKSSSVYDQGDGDTQSKLTIGNDQAGGDELRKGLDNSLPLYGANLRHLIHSKMNEISADDFDSNRWKTLSFIRCHPNNSRPRRSQMLLQSETTDNLTKLLKIQTQYQENMTNILDHRFGCMTSKVIASSQVEMKRKSSAMWDPMLKRLISRSISNDHQLNLPDGKLIAADSGKLQVLDLLIKLLMSEQHRLVILSHMIQLLDILEAYLDSRHLLYLRLDAGIKTEKQHLIIQEFNRNKKISCFLVSSRLSCTVGFDGLDADAVVLYDVDLNATVNRQINQLLLTMAKSHSLRVFRFVTKDTVEEFLTSKSLDESNQLYKGILSDSGPLYTWETMKQLFKSSPLIQEMEENKQQLNNDGIVSTDVVDEKEFPFHIIEEALNSVEDKDDVVVTTHENINENEEIVLKLGQHVDDEINDSVKMTEVQHYAVSFVKRHTEILLSDDTNVEDMEFTIKSEVSIKRKHDVNGDEDNLLFTYPMDHENKQVFVSDVTGEEMPLWMPLTPPQDDSDVYIDHTLSFIYESTVMSESQLPPVYVKTGNKRLKMENHASRRIKILREEQTTAPRSLFERPQAVLRYEREARLMKQGLVKPLKQTVPPPIRPTPEPPSDQPDWLIHEDWALLQAFQMHHDLSINMTTSVSTSAHIANWELISDVVNTCSRTHRSPKNCKSRYESVILPREEGKFLYDINPRKLKKCTKGLYKTKNNQPMKTNQLYMQDGSHALTNCFVLRFDAVKSIASKRTTVPPSSTNPVSGRNTKHISILAECGIIYDQPLSPLHIATLRAERIAKDKKQQAQTTIPVSGNDQQSSVVSAQYTMQRAVQQAPVAAPMVLQPSTPTIVQAGQQQQQQQQQQLVLGQHLSAAQAVVSSTHMSGVDGRQQQMTIVPAVGSQLQAVVSGPSALLATSLHKTGGNTASIVTSMPLTRSLTMTGIIVSQATGLNRAQTVVTSGTLVNLNNQTMRAIRSVVPLSMRDTLSTTNSQQTVNITAQDARSLAQVIATSGLTPTQQKQGIGVAQLNTAPVQHQLLNLTGVSKSQTPGGIQPLQLQVRANSAQKLNAVLQHGRPVQITAMQLPAGSTMTTGLHKTYTHPMAALLKTRQPQGKTVTGTVQSSVNLPQIQVTKQQQQVEGMPIQQHQQHLQQQGSTSVIMTPSVTTLLKAVPNTVSLPVTIPMSTISPGITQQKIPSGKAANSVQQMRQMQVPKRPATAVQLTGQKVAAFQQLTKSGSSPVILQQQKVHVQSQQIQIPARFISSTSSTGTVIATQILHQTNATPCLPASVSLPPGPRASVTVTIPGTTVVPTIPMSSLSSGLNQANAATTTVKLMPPTQAMIYTKQNKDALLSGGGAQKTAVVMPAGLQQVTVRPATVQQAAASSQLLQAHITMATSGTAGRHPQHLPAELEKAVQEVVQQAQAQARQIQVPQISFTTSTVIPAMSQTGQSQVVPTGAQHLLLTTVAPTATAAGPSSGTSPLAGDDLQQSKSPHVMRLRNQEQRR